MAQSYTYLRCNQCQYICVTVLPAKSDNDAMFCLQSYKGLIVDISLVYESYSDLYTSDLAIRDVQVNVLLKVSKGTKIRNQYNQVPHLTQDTSVGPIINSVLLAGR